MHAVTEFDKEVKRFQAEAELMSLEDQAKFYFAIAEDKFSQQLETRKNVVGATALASRPNLVTSQKYAVIQAGLLELRMRDGTLDRYVENPRNYFEKEFLMWKKVYEFSKNDQKEYKTT